MANYDARINITANASQADRELQRLQGRLEQVERAANLDIGAAIRLGGIQKSIATVNQLDRAVSSLRSTVRTINSPGGGNLGDAFRTAAAAANQFFDSLSTGERFLSNSIAGLKEQASAFATLAGNISSAEARFVDYVQGAQSAQDKGLRPLFRQFEALRALYEEGVTGSGVEINTREMGAGLFEQLSREVPQTEAALKAFSTELQRVRSLIGSESIAAFGIEQQIIEIEQQLLTIEQNRLETRAALNREMSSPVQGALSRMEGRAANLFGISDEQINESLNTRAEQYVKQQEELDSLRRTLSSMEGAKYDPLGISDNQVNQGLEERASLYMRQRDELASLQSVLGSMEGRKYDPLNITDDQINQGLEERARNYAQQARDIADLQQALGAMESRQGNWGSALGISESDIAADRAKELEVQWTRLNEAAQRIASQAPQAAAALRAFKFETLAKDADAYTRALLNQQRTLDEYADSANRAAAASAELGYGGELPALRPAGFTNQDVRIKNLVDDQTAAAKIVADLEIDLDKMVNQFEIENIERQLKAELDRIDTILDARTKAGEKWWAEEKKKLDEKTKLEQKQERQSRLPFLERRFGARRSRAISEGLIGGAFPLLFGQGIGAAALGGLGGAAGGFAGGGLGFGLSLVGTALGTAFDTLNQAAQDTGKALRYPIEGFEQLKEAGLLASRQQEYYISKLIEAGRLTEAAGEIQAEIIRKIGVQGVEDLQRLGDSSSRLSKAWAEFNLQLQAALAGPMADLLNWVGGIVGEINTANRQAAELRDFMQSLTPQQQKEYLRRSVELRNQNNGVVDPVAIQRLRREFLPNGAQQPQAVFTQEQLDAQKQAQAVTQELQAQVALQAKQLSLTGLTLERDGARYINAARAVALQEYENKLLEIKNGWIGKIFNAEQNLAQIRGANLELAARLRQVNEEIAQRQEQLYQNSLQAEIALYQEAQKRNDLIVRFAAFNEGEEAGLKRRLSLMESMRQQRLAEFYTEAELAMIQARKNGTAEQTAALYASRLITLQSELDLEEGITKQQLAQLQLSKFIAAEESKRQAADPFVQFRETQQLEQQYAKTYYRLLKEGVIPAEAERIASFERLVSERLRAIDSDIAFNQVLLDQARESGVAATEINKLVDSIENLNKARGVVTEQAALGPGPAVEEIPGAKIQEFISTAGQELKDLESVAIRVSQGIGDAVGNSLTNGINGLIEGTATAKEVFANFLNDVAGILMQESAKMIATYIAIGIARQFAGFFGGGSNEDPLKGVGGADWMKYTTPNANGNMYASNGIVPFANGGMFTNSIVSSPTLFKFADGGVSQMGLMGEAGPEAIMPLKRGPGGRLGVDASGVGGGNVEVGQINITVENKGETLSPQAQKQIAGQVRGIVLATLVDQQRSGGILR